jgi:hypothetical protein
MRDDAQAALIWLKLVVAHNSRNPPRRAPLGCYRMKRIILDL